MGPLRSLVTVNGRKLLSLVLAALAMQALMPAGLMVAPAAGHGAQVILCPQTHPLAYAAARRAAQAAHELAAMHAAMGHAPTAPGDAAPGSTAGSPAQSCAYAGAGALAALLPDHEPVSAAFRAEPPAPPLPPTPLRLAAPPHLRPPLRAPPSRV